MNYIINEELGIAKKVSELSEKLKKQLFYQIEKNDNNSFEFEDIKVVYEDDFKVNPLKVISASEEVLSVEDFIPDYLRITEAEYNLEHNND